jgi:deoxyribonucleoside regulator
MLFTNTAEYKRILDLWADIDAVILGIGSYPSMPDPATAARFGNLLHEKNAVGMVATYFYDREGNIITCETDIVIRIPLGLLRNAKKALAISTGLNKVDSIIGALRTGLITHLITDEMTAREIITSARM